MLPAIREIGRIAYPVELQRRHDARGHAIEAGGDVLLPIGHEIALGICRIDGDMDAEPEPRGLGDILHQLHARPIIANPIDVEAGLGLGDVRGNAIDQAVRAALGAVDEFEGVIGVGAGEGAEMVGDGIVVAVVPIPDRAEHPVRMQVDGIGAAAHFCRQQGDPASEASAADIGSGIRHLADDALLLRTIAGARARALAG